MFHQAQATDYIDLLQQLEQIATASNINTVAINVAGTGWAVGDTFTINGGVSTHGATGEILTVAAGVPLTIRILNGGAYTVNPGIAAATTAILPATGINLTVDTTILATGWATDRSAITTAPERELLMTGTGAGADQIFIGMQTGRDGGSGAFFWELSGNTGFDNGQPWASQPGASKQAAATVDLYVQLNNGVIDFWFFIDAFRIIGVFKTGSTYTNIYMGFVNTYATPGEYPYPLVIIGSSSNKTLPFNTSTILMSGMTDPIASFDVGGSVNGPGAIREVDGQWYTLRNSGGAGVSRTAYRERVIWPQGGFLQPTDIDVLPQNRFIVNNEGGQSLSQIWTNVGVPGTPLSRLKPTPMTGGDIQFLWPNVIYQMRPSQVFLGELSDVHPIYTAILGIVSEDTMTDANNDVFIVFQNCNRTDSWSHFAVKRT